MSNSANDPFPQITRISLLAATVGFSGAAAGQIPAHAVALNPTVNLRNLELVRAGDVLHAVGRELVASQSYRVRYARSPDGGRSWPQREVLLATATDYLYYGALVVDGPAVHVGVDEQIHTPHVVSSYDGGLTWQTPVVIDVPGAGIFAGAPRLHASGGVVNAVWAATSPSGPILVTRRSADGGMTWTSPSTRLDAGAPTGATEHDADLRLFGEGSALHVFWCRITDAGTPQQILHACHQRSLDGGVTWQASPTTVATTTTPPSQGTWQPAAVGAGRLFAASGTTLYRSLDQGASWQPVTGFTLGAGTRIDDVLADGDNVFAFGRQFGHVATNASPDGGTAWRANPYRILLAVNGVQIHGAAAGDAQFLSVHYPSTQFLGPAVIQSDDHCDNWRLLEGSSTLALADADGAVAVIHGPGTTVHAYVAEGHSTLGQGTAGSGTTAPTLGGRGLAGLGRTFTLEIDGTVPGALIGSYVTFGPTTAVPLGPATLYLSQHFGPFVFTTSPTGAATLSLSVPADAAFSGIRIASQAFALDPGAAGGFAATRAVETWLR